MMVLGYGDPPTDHASTASAGKRRSRSAHSRANRTSRESYVQTKSTLQDRPSHRYGACAPCAHRRSPYPVWARRLDQALDLGSQDSFLVIAARRERRLPGCAFRTHLSILAARACHRILSVDDFDAFRIWPSCHQPGRIGSDVVRNADRRWLSRGALRQQADADA